MSYQAMAWATKQKVGSWSAKFVLIVLANYADNAGVCWPSQERLANDTEMTDRGIRKCIAHLVEAGFLHPVQHRPGTGGGRKTNIYRLRLPEQGSDCVEGQPEPDAQATGTTFLRQPEPRSSKPVKDNQSEEPVRLKEARKRATPIPDGFPAEPEIRWALKEHPKLSAWGEADKFRDYALQHGKTYLDWSAAWRTWCRNATRWAAESNRRFA